MAITITGFCNCHNQPWLEPIIQVMTMKNNCMNHRMSQLKYNHVRDKSSLIQWVCVWVHYIICQNKTMELLKSISSYHHHQQSIFLGNNIKGYLHLLFRQGQIIKQIDVQLFNCITDIHSRINSLSKTYG